MIAGEELGMLRMTRVPFPGHFLRDINSNLNCHRICGRRADLRDRGGHAKGSPVVPVHWHRYFGMARVRRASCDRSNSSAISGVVINGVFLSSSSRM